MDKTYLISGASSDVGVRLIERMGERGESCTVIAQYNSSRAKLDELATRFPSLGICSCRCDLSRAEELSSLIARLKDEGCSPTHILHLAAPKLKYERLRKTSRENYERHFSVQVLAFGDILAAFLPGMAKRGFGRVVALVSSAVLGAAPKFMPDYVVAKHALLGLIKAAAAEYAEKGLCINGVSPNMMETKFLSEVDPRFVEINASGSAMKRNVRIDETCAAIEYLMSDEASYINGTNLNLSGGDYM